MAGLSFESASPGPFPSTHWTWIRAGEDPAALETLARVYWKPIRAYLRAALKKSDEESLDLTQDFFVWTIESGFLSKADPARGRFRAFLKTALRNYAAKADERASAQKRGGTTRFVPLSAGAADGDDALGDGGNGLVDELADARARTPEELLDLAWKDALVGAAVERTEQQFESEGRGVVFSVFRAWFLDDRDDVDHRAVAERFGITTVDVANHLARGRRAYREHLRSLVRETVGSGADLDAEFAWLVGARPAGAEPANREST